MNLEEILEFVERAHAGQTRNDGVTPYFEHIKKVVSIAQRAGEGFEVLVAAANHDVCEETEYTVQDLLEMGMPAESVRAVALLTRKDGDDYSEYIKGVSRDEIAKKVKIYDMLANLGDSPSPRQVKRYAAALEFLLTGGEKTD